MHKHRGFPSRLPGTEYQFTIRRANPKGATRIVARQRYRDRSPNDQTADENFLACLVRQFGDQPFVRGNLDAGRLGWLFGREVLAVKDDFDPEDYEAMLIINRPLAEQNYPRAFDPTLWKDTK